MLHQPPPTPLNSEDTQNLFVHEGPVNEYEDNALILDSIGTLLTASYLFPDHHNSLKSLDPFFKSYKKENLHQHKKLIDQAQKVSSEL